MKNKFIGLIWLVFAALLSYSSAILQPFDSPTRFSKSLDGIWDFRLIRKPKEFDASRLLDFVEDGPLVQTSFLKLQFVLLIALRYITVTNARAVQLQRHYRQ